MTRVLLILSFLLTVAGCASLGGPPGDKRAASGDGAPCISKHSFARCQLIAARIPITFQDAVVSEGDYRAITQDERHGSIAGAALGVGQLAGQISTVAGVSQAFMGSMNLVSGFMDSSIQATLRSYTQKDFPMAFIPQSAADNGFEAARLFEEGVVNAFVAAIPGATGATRELVEMRPGRVFAYVVQGGVCAAHRCLLVGEWSPTHCRRGSPCEFKRKEWTLIDADAHIGGGKVWRSPWRNHAIVLHIDPPEDAWAMDAKSAPWPELPGLPSKLELFQAVSGNSPEWLWYFVARNPKQGVSLPVVLVRGRPHFFVKAKG